MIGVVKGLNNRKGFVAVEIHPDAFIQNYGCTLQSAKTQLK